MSLTLVLFLIGVLGFVFNRKNIILMLISIEIMLLSITFLILLSSINLDDIVGQTYAIYIIIIAGAESAIGLAILVAFYRLNHSFIYYYRQIIPSKGIQIPSRGIQIRNYSNMSCIRANSNKLKINPWFLTGLFDAEGSFIISIVENKRYSTGWAVQARVQMKMHERDRPLVQSIQDFFDGIGYISKPNDRNTVEFRVSTINDIIYKIIPHFNNYPLMTKKRFDYLKFEEGMSLIVDNKHNTLNGLSELLEIKSLMNLGLSTKLKESFKIAEPSLQSIAVTHKEIDYKNLPSEWVAGFCTGESNFFIASQKSQTKSGISVSLRFSIAQHSRDFLLLESLSNVFKCGRVTKYKNREISEFIVTKIDDIIKYIIPFFEKYSIKGHKNSAYLYFKDASVIIKNKSHLKEDLNKVLELKERISNLYTNE